MTLNRLTSHTCPGGPPAPLPCLPYLTHLIPLISSLVETAKTELGVLDKGDIQNVQDRGYSRAGLGSTGLTDCIYQSKFLAVG